MPTNHDETLEQLYAREQSEHRAELTKRTPEEIAYMEQLLHNVLAERDQLATKAADLDLALFAENQKRHDVERERDQLLEALDGLLSEHAVPSSGCKDRQAYEQALSAIAAVKGGTPC